MRHYLGAVQEQVEIWDGLWPVRFFLHAPAWLVRFVTSMLAILLFNRFVLWCVCLPPEPDSPVQLFAQRIDHIPLMLQPCWLLEESNA